MNLTRSRWRGRGWLEKVGAGRGRVQVLDLITSNLTMLSMLPAQQLQLDTPSLCFALFLYSYPFVLFLFVYVFVLKRMVVCYFLRSISVVYHS